MSTEQQALPPATSPSRLSREVPSRGRPLESHAPRLVVATAVLAAFAAYALLGSNVGSPRAFGDELVYFDAAASLANGNGLEIRGSEPYRYAPVYPIVLAPVLRLTHDREQAYDVVKVLNALLFALAAIPIFLLARRVLSPWPSALVSVISLAVPSAMYVSLVMTESLAYLVAAWTLLALALVLERPSVGRQAVALATIAVATATRPQFVAFYPALVAAIAIDALRERDGRGGTRRLVRYWPTALAGLLGGLVLFARPFVLHVTAATSFGAYSPLWRTYDLPQVVENFAYELANLMMYMGFVPLIVMPIVLGMLWRRTDLPGRRAFVGLFAGVNCAFLLLIAMFDSANAEQVDFSILHDRYLFYVVPLWLIGLFVWLEGGVPRPRASLCLGSALAIALVLIVPLSPDARNEGILHVNSLATTIWAGVDHASADAVPLGGHGVLLVLTLALVVALMRLPTPALRFAPAVVLIAFAVAGDAAWYLAGREATPWHYALPSEGRSWVDENVGADSSVALLVADRVCPGWGVPDKGSYLAEFFNSSVSRVADVGASRDALPHVAVDVARDGRLLLEAGRPLRSDYVIVHSGVTIDGQPVAYGSRGRLVLWRVGGPVRAVGVNSSQEFEVAGCLPSSERVALGD